jgi:hypothetical protein
VLTSFELADGELFDRSNITFNSNSGNNFISMLPCGGVRTIDLNVLFMGKDSNDILQAYISPGEKMSLTLHFRKKSTNVFDTKVYGALTGLAPALSAVIRELLNASDARVQEEMVQQAIAPRPLVSTRTAGSRPNTKPRL